MQKEMAENMGEGRGGKTSHLLVRATPKKQVHMLKDIGIGCSHEDKELDQKEEPAIYSF